METKMEKAPPSFEDVLEELGMPGRFQITQLMLLFATKLSTTFITLNFVFLGYEPSHVCNYVNETSLLQDHELLNDSSAVIGYHSCDLTVSTNRSGQLEQVTKMACPSGRNFSDARGTTLISEWDLVCESSGTAEISQASYTLGLIVGGILGSSLSDRFGRKPIIVVFSFLMTLSEGILIFAPNIYMIIAVRLLSGFFLQGFICSIFVWAIELSVPRHRQKFGVAICLVWVTHVLLLGGIAYVFRNFSWRYFQGTIAATGLACLLFPYFLRESPRWLAINNYRERTLKILRDASKVNGKSFEKIVRNLGAYWATRDQLLSGDSLQDTPKNSVQCTAESKKKDKMSICTILRHKSLLRMTFLGCFIWTTHNVTYYGLYMTSTDITDNRYLNFTLMALVEIPSNFVILVLMNKMKRKTVLISFLALTAVSLMASSIFLNFSDDSWESDAIITILFVLGKFAIGSSYNVIYIITPEMYPTNLRSLGYGICCSVGRVGAMLAPFSRPLFHIAKWAPGVIFTVMCIISVFMVMGLPETKDRNLPNDLRDLESTKKNRCEDDSNDTNRHLDPGINSF